MADTWTKDERALAKFAREHGGGATVDTWSTVDEWAQDMEWPVERARKALERLWRRGRLRMYDPGAGQPVRVDYIQT